MHIAVAGWQHETNTFSPHQTTLDHFIQSDSWPALSCGSEIIEKFQRLNVPISGFIQEAKKRGHDIVPLQWCSATPSGKVNQATFEHLLSNLMSLLKEQPHVDAVYLDLHGAMVTEQHDDADGKIIQAVRQAVGEDIPILVSLDLHANMTPTMLEAANIIIAYRTYPHVDMADVGALVARHVEHAINYRMYFQHVPFLTPITSQCTLNEPAATLYRLLHKIEKQHSVVLSYTQGFPLADTYHTGPCVFGYGVDSDQLQLAITALMEAITAQRHAFCSRYYLPDEAIAYSRQHLATATKPIIFADTQDNPGCGGAGNTTGILAALIDHQVVDSVVAMIYDPVVAALCHDVGEGEWITTVIGVEKLPIVAQVKCVREGSFLATGPFYHGSTMHLGPMALLNIQGVDVVVTSKNVQVADREMLQHLQIDIVNKKLLVLKSSVHFRADFQELVDNILIVTAPGLNIADLKQLTLSKLRPGVDIL